MTAVEPLGGMDFGEGQPADAEFTPCRIPSGESAAMRLKLKSSEKAEYGIAKVEIARLGEKARETKKVRFLIRHS